MGTAATARWLHVTAATSSRHGFHNDTNWEWLRHRSAEALTARIQIETEMRRHHNGNGKNLSLYIDTYIYTPNYTRVG